MASIGHAGADAHKQDPFLLVLSVKFSNSNIHGGLADGVSWGNLYLEFVRRIKIRHASGQGDDLLCITLENERRIQVEQVDV